MATIFICILLKENSVIFILILLKLVITIRSFFVEEQNDRGISHQNRQQIWVTGKITLICLSLTLLLPLISIGQSAIFSPTLIRSPTRRSRLNNSANDRYWASSLVVHRLSFGWDLVVSFANQSYQIYSFFSIVIPMTLIVEYSK